MSSEITKLQQITTESKENSKIGKEKLKNLQPIAPKSRNDWRMWQLNGAKFQNQSRGNKLVQSNQSGRLNQSMKCDEMGGITVEIQPNSDKI